MNLHIFEQLLNLYKKNFGSILSIFFFEFQQDNLCRLCLATQRTIYPLQITIILTKCFQKMEVIKDFSTNVKWKTHNTDKIQN